MKQALLVCLLFSLSTCLFSDEQIIKYEDIELKKIDLLDLTLIEKSSKVIDFRLLSPDEVMNLIKNTSNFDFEDYLIRNERSSKGTSLIDKKDFNTSSIDNPRLRESVELKQKELNDFRLKYKKLKIIHKIRIKAISHIVSKQSFSIEEQDLSSYLQPNELLVLKDVVSEKLRTSTSFYLKYLKSFKLLQKVFEINHDLPLLSECTDKDFSVKEILGLLRFDDNYLSKTNLSFLRKKLIENQIETSIEDLEISFNLWKDSINHKKYLLEDFSNIQPALNQLGILTLIIISKKMDKKNKDIIKKIIGENIYQQIFVDKISIDRLGEFNLDKNENR